MDNTDTTSHPHRPSETRTPLRGPDWDRVPFDVPCMRCGAALNGRTKPVCPKCDLRFDWKRVLPLEDLRCEKCAYQLLGLSEQRCPECGTPFEWPDVLAAARGRRSRLFEFLWFSNPVPGFLKSMWLAALRPHRLWALYEHQLPPRVGPLLLFMLAQWVIFAYGWHAVGLIADPVMNAISSALNARGPVPDPATGQSIPSAGLPLQFVYRFRVDPLFLPSIALWHLVSFASIQLLFQTKRRLGIGWRETLRVYAHATAFAALCTAGWCVLEMLLDATLFFNPPWSGGLTPAYVWLGKGVFVLGVTVTWVHLSIGLGRHLGIRHAWIVAAACLLIGYLVSFPSVT